MKLTWKKIIWFGLILFIGIIGLMVADQYDFLGGRENSETSIGTGTTAAVSGPFLLKQER